MPELEWMVIGESISFKNMLYVDVWDNIAPLSALTYAIIDYFFGRSQATYWVLAVILVFSQCYLFNRLLISNKAYKENTYIPALIYAILMGLFFDFFTFSPVLLSGIFLLGVINGIFHHIAHKARDEQFLNMGFALGTAVLFFLPSLIYLPVVILTLGLYSNMDFKKYLLLFFGFVFPIVLVSIFFFWHGALLEFYDQFFLSWLTISSNPLVNTKTLIYISIPTGILLIFSWFNIYTAKRYNNQQTNFMLVMMWFFVGAAIIMVMVQERAPQHLMVFAPPAAFFLSHFFLVIRRRFLAEVFFLTFFILTLVVNLGTVKNIIIPQHWFQFTGLVVNATPWDELVHNKKVLIIGEDINAYRNAKLATPYLNWDLAKRHLQQLQSYNNLSAVYKNFRTEMPEVIIDQKGVVPQLFQRMPTIGARYQKSPGGDSYLLKN